LVSIVKNSLNGDAATTDPAVRRTLYAVAQELDEQSAHWDKRINDVARQIDANTATLSEEVGSVRRLLISLTGTVIAGIIVAIVSLATRF
jgi:hypothetical protein